MAYGIYIQAMMLTLPWDRLHEAKAGQVPPSRGGGASHPAQVSYCWGRGYRSHKHRDRNTCV